MAEAIVIRLVENLIQLVKYEITRINRFKDEVQSLREELGSMRVILKDAGQKFYEHEAPLEKMETQIRDLEGEIDDAANLFMSDAILKNDIVRKNKKKKGDLDWAEELMLDYRNICFQKDRFGRTPLHIAAQKGRVDVIDVILNSFPESVKEVTATRETILHMAVIHNKTNVVEHLLKWVGERPDFVYLLNLGDYEGNTALHLSTSRKQLQTLRVLLSSESVDVNALNSGSFTALDILYVLPFSGKIDMEIDMILRQAGAVRARDLTNRRIKCGGDDYYHNRDFSDRLSNVSSTDVKSIKRSREILLVVATLIATVTFSACFHLPDSSTSSVGYVYNSVTGTIQKNIKVPFIFSLFLLFNSMTFLVTVGTILFLLHGFPLKPWPQISFLALFGSYICAIMAASPNEALALLLISIPFLLLAAAGKPSWLCNPES